MKTYKQLIEQFVVDIEKVSERNKYFRKVLYTTPRTQLVVMSLLPGQDIGKEIHGLDQFIRIEKGAGYAVLNGKMHKIGPGTALVIPAGTEHNITCWDKKDYRFTGPMKLYTVYAPPNHKKGTVHKTKQDAEQDNEQFNGKIDESVTREKYDIIHGFITPEGRVITPPRAMEHSQFANHLGLDGLHDALDRGYIRLHHDRNDPKGPNMQLEFSKHSDIARINASTYLHKYPTHYAFIDKRDRSDFGKWWINDGKGFDPNKHMEAHNFILESFFIAEPSITQRIAQRKSIRKRARSRVKVKAGYGILVNPKRTIYNRIYRLHKISF